MGSSINNKLLHCICRRTHAHTPNLKPMLASRKAISVKKGPKTQDRRILHCYSTTQLPNKDCIVEILMS